MKYKEKCINLRIQLMDYNNGIYELIKIITKMSLGGILTEEDMKIIKDCKNMDIEL